MKTQEFTVNSLGAGMQEALRATEALGKENGLNDKELLHLRLLGEELFGMVRSITGELEASYYAEQENKAYTLHLCSDVHMTKEIRDELLAVSDSVENAVAKGFMGKLRDMIGTALLPEDDQPSLLSLGVMSMGSPTGLRTGTGSYDWSLKKFKAEAGETEEARDDLERSIVANIADDIIVSIEGSRVDLTILKSF